MQRFHFHSTDSTNSEARRLACEWPGEQLVVTATTQSAGRGRYLREWHSPRGGAWMSVVWPTLQDPKAYQPVSLLAAIAVRRALAGVAGTNTNGLRIKWPNDLLIDDLKVAGILCEQWPGFASQQGVLVVGIGVNVDFDPAVLGTDLRHQATTLSTAWGRPISVETVVSAITRHLAEALEAFEEQGLTRELLVEFEQHLAYVGTEQTYQLPSGTVRGRVLGIDSAGRLLLERAGEQIACEVGEFLPCNGQQTISRPPDIDELTS